MPSDFYEAQKDRAMKRYLVIVNFVLIMTAALITLPEPVFAGPNNIYGVRRSKNSRNIFGPRRKAINSGKAYGDHGSRIRNNYYGKGRSPQANSAKKSKSEQAPPPDWDDIFQDNQRLSQPRIVPQGMEAF